MALDIRHQLQPSLLTAADPPPVTVANPQGSSPFLLIGDHAGNVIPSRLNLLGLGEADLTRHIAWDIGVDGLGVRLADLLDATYVKQTYSRLVADCNRRPDALDAVAPISDGTTIPGNVELTEIERAARIAEVHEPYHRAITNEIERRCVAGQASIVITLHSFTPALADGALRPWHVGVLYDGGDSSFAKALLGQLRGEPSLGVGDNEPYRMDAIDYTIPRHCYAAGLPYAELEIRQDLVGTGEGQAQWGAFLTDVLGRV